MQQRKRILIKLIIILLIQLILLIITTREVVAMGSNIAIITGESYDFSKINLGEETLTVLGRNRTFNAQKNLKTVIKYSDGLRKSILHNKITNKNYTQEEGIIFTEETVKKPELKVTNITKGSDGNIVLAGEVATIAIEVSGENIKFDTSKIKVRKKDEISISGDPVKSNGNGGAELGNVTIEKGTNEVIIKMQTFKDSEKLGYIVIDINEGFASNGKEYNEFLRKTYYVASLHETARRNDNTKKIDLTAMVGVHNSFYVKDYKFSIIKGENKANEAEDNWTTNEYTFTDLGLNSDIKNKVEVEINFYIDKNDTTYVRKGKIWKTIDVSKNKINPKKELEVHFIDMSVEDGTGDCIFVRIPDGENYKTMLIDAGNNNTNSANHINQYLIENGYVDINEENIAKIDYLIMTHSHGDHIGGLLKLTGLKWKSDEQREYKRVKTGLDYGNIYYDFDNIIVGCDYEYNYKRNSTYKLLIDYAKQEKNFIQLTAGNVLEIGDIIINIFNPYPEEVLPLEWLGDYNKMKEERAEGKTTPEYFRDEDWVSKNNTENNKKGVRRLAQTAENNRSIVAKLCYGGKRILLTGDIVFYTEEVLTGKIAEEIKQKKGLMIDEIINVKDSNRDYTGITGFTGSVIGKDNKDNYYLNDTNKIAVESTEINLVTELLEKYKTENYDTLESKYKLSRFTKKDLSADILKKGHHSVFNSTSIEFLENVNSDKIVVTGNDRSDVSSKTVMDPTLTSLYYQPAYRIAKYYLKREKGLDNIESYIVSTAPIGTTDSFNCICISTGGEKAEFNVEVVENTVSDIEIISKPSKVTYYEGETLNTKGLKIKVTHVNGSSEEVTSGFTCTPTSLNTVGTQEITVTYGGKSAKFSVTVVENTLSKIEIVSKPSKVKYYEGDTLDTSGLKLKATYANGTSKEVTSGFTCTPTELNTIGTQEITVTYGGKNAKFSVTVVENTLSKIEIVSKPSKVKYYEGDTLDTSGLKLKATYANGTSKEVTSGFTCTPTSLNTVGTQEITVTYGGKSAKFSVEVIEKEVEEKLEIKLKEEADYEIKQDGENVYLENIKPGTTIETILNNIETNGEIKIYKEATQITDKSTKTTTGITIVISKGTEKIELKIVVIGDLNGDGQMNDIDLLMLARYKAKLYKELRGEYLRASDILRNGVYADDMDLLKMARVLVSLDKI